MSNEAEGQGKAAGTNLTTVPEYAQTALVLNDLKHRFAGRVFESLETDAQRKAARKDIAEVRDYRTGLEAERKRIKAPALERCRLIDAEAARLTTELRALEDPMKAQLDAKEAEIEAEKIRKANAEAERVKGHTDAIQRIRDFPLSLQGKPASVIEARIDELVKKTTLRVGDDIIPWCTQFEEFEAQADDALKASLASSRDVLQRQRDHEAEQEQIKRDRDELAKQRAENERLQCEADERREADARREREDREAKERKEQERRQAIDETIERIANYAQGIRYLSWKECDMRCNRLFEYVQTLLHFDFGERSKEAFDLIESTRKACDEARKDASDREIEQERERELQAKRQRELDEAAERQLQEQARLDRERAEHEAKVERDRIAKLGLMEAVKAVVEYVEKGNSDVPRCILDLCEVYYALPQEKREAAKPVRKPRAQA